MEATPLRCGNVANIITFIWHDNDYSNLCNTPRGPEWSGINGTNISIHPNDMNYNLDLVLSFVVFIFDGRSTF